MVVKRIGLAIGRWNWSTRHRGPQIEGKTQIASAVGEPDVNRSCTRTRIASLLLLLVNLFSRPILAKAQVAPSTLLKSTSQTIEQLTDKLNPAVVEIDVKAWKVDDSTDKPESAGYMVHDRCLGTGVLLTQTGEILTNHHVIRGSQQITVHLLDSSKDYGARIIGDDPDADLTLLKIEGSGLPHFELSVDSHVKQGQIVLAIGSPYGLGHSVTLGIVSSPSRELDLDTPTTYIQTDAPINPGNSGGPLIDLDGHLVGINTLIYTSSGGSEGLGFAIPVETVIHSVAAMEVYGSVKRPYFGVSLQLVTEAIASGLKLGANSGLLVNDVDIASPAFKAGIEAGDVILSVQGKATPDWKRLQTALDSLHIGESAALTIERNGTQRSISVLPQYDYSRRLELMDYANVAQNFVDQIGIVGVNLNGGVRHLFPATRVPGGVIIAAKCDGMNYDTDELKADDILHQVNGHSIHDLEDLRSYLSQAVSREPLIFQVEREDHLIYVAITSRN